MAILPRRPTGRHSGRPGVEVHPGWSPLLGGDAIPERAASPGTAQPGTAQPGTAQPGAAQPGAAHAVAGAYVGGAEVGRAEVAETDVAGPQGAGGGQRSWAGAAEAAMASWDPAPAPRADLPTPGAAGTGVPSPQLPGWEHIGTPTYDAAAAAHRPVDPAPASTSVVPTWQPPAPPSWEPPAQRPAPSGWSAVPTVPAPPSRVVVPAAAIPVVESAIRDAPTLVPDKRAVVRLGFADSSTLDLRPEDPIAKALQTVASTLLGAPGQA